MKTNHAQLKVKRGKTIAIEIPTDEEIERIAMRMHAAGKPCLKTIRNCKVFYRPRLEQSYTMTKVDPFTGERGKPSPPRKSMSPAEFTFGYQIRGQANPAGYGPDVVIQLTTPSNQSMKPTAPSGENVSVFATTPCRGLISFSLG
jgi:hypothetical protein